MRYSNPIFTAVQNRKALSVSAQDAVTGARCKVGEIRSNRAGEPLFVPGNDGVGDEAQQQGNRWVQMHTRALRRRLQAIQTYASAEASSPTMHAVAIKTIQAPFQPEMMG